MRFAQQHNEADSRWEFSLRSDDEERNLSTWNWLNKNQELRHSGKWLNDLLTRMNEQEIESINTAATTSSSCSISRENAAP